MAIRYTPEYNDKIRKIVKNYNAKVDRGEANNLKHIPSKITTKGLKAAYQTRSDLERRLKQLESFNIEKSTDILKVGKDNIKMSGWEFETLKANRFATIRKLEAELTRQRKIDRSKRRIFPSERTRQIKATLRSMKVNPVSASANQLTRIKNVIDRYGERRVETDQQFYENFFDMLWASVPYVDADEDTIQYIHDSFEELSPNQLLELYNNEPLVKNIVEDYHKYIDTQGYAITDAEADRKNQALQDLADALPRLIEKYKKL